MPATELVAENAFCHAYARRKPGSTQYPVRCGKRRSVDCDGGSGTVNEPIGEPSESRRIVEFLEDFLSGKVTDPPRAGDAPSHAFVNAQRKPNATTDKYVSLINLAIIAAFESVIGATVDPLRFRTNLYFDCAQPWSELG